MYHKSFQKNWNLSFAGSQIVENPELLGVLDEINSKPENAHISIEIQDPPQPATPQKDVPISFESPKLNQSILVPQNKQLETRLPSGKRRITPMLLTAVKDGASNISEK